MKMNGMTNRLLSLLLCLVMVVGVLPTMPVLAAEQVSACDHSAVTWTDVAASSSLPAARFADGGTFRLTGDVALDGTVTLTSGARVHIDLNGYTLKGSTTLFSLQGTEDAEVLLTICDSSAAQSGTVDAGGSSEAGIFLQSYGTLYIYGGTFTGAKVTASNQAMVTSHGDTCAVEMYGGSLTGNEAASGGAVVMRGGTFTLHDGEISGNKATTGGAVYCSLNGKFFMEGGSISDNQATNGGALYGYQFFIKDGVISGNKATANGGVLWFMGNKSMEISGGTFTGNEAGTNGAIIYSNGNAAIPELKISGGTFTGNTTAGASSIQVSGVALVMTGGTVEGNSSTSGKPLTVSLHNYQNASSGTFTGSAVLADGGVKVSDANGVIPAPVATVKKLTEGAKIYSLAALNVSETDLSITVGNDKGLFLYTYDPEILSEHVTSWTPLGGEISAIESGNYVLTEDLVLLSTITLSGDVSICLNNQKLSGKQAPYFIIPEGTSLTVCECRRDKLGTVDGSTLGTASVNGAFAQITGGSFTLNGGTVTGFATSGAGGVCYVTGKTSEVTFAGGKVTGNSAANGAVVRMSSGTFNISGDAVISDNTTDGSGSVLLTYIEDQVPVVNITGGTIADNYSGTGGMIHSNGAKMTITGGTISGNRSNSATLALQATELSMSGGTISGNLYKNGKTAIRPAITLGTHKTYGPCSAEFTGTAVVLDNGVRIDPRAGAETSAAEVCQLKEGAMVLAVTALTTDSSVKTWDSVGTNVAYLPLDSGIETAHEEPRLVAGSTTGLTEGTYILTGDTLLGSTQTLTGNVTLCLNGYTLTGTAAPYFKVGAGLELTICDCSEAGTGTIDGSTLESSTASGLIHAYGTSSKNGGTVNMTGGTVTGHKTTANGGAFFLQHLSTLNVTGGKICGNESGKHGSAIHFNGKGTVNLTNCEITDNITGGDGTIITYGVTLNIGEGVVISDNKVSSGSVVHVNLGTLNVTDGIITDNRSSGRTVWVSDTNSSMSGGEIFDNTTLTGTAVAQFHMSDYSASGKGSTAVFTGTAYVGPSGVSRSSDINSATVQALEKGSLICSSFEMTVGDDTVARSGKWYLPKEDAVDTHEGYEPLKGNISTLEEGKYFLVDDVYLTTSVTISKDVTICLNGYRITGVAAPYFNISGGTTIICDHSEHADGMLDGSVLKYSAGSLVRVRSGAELILQSGGIGNHVTTGHGAAIYVTNGTFRMEGGFISGNTTSTGRGAICADGESAFVTITDGELYDNTATYGGVIYSSEAQVSIEGGEFYRNTGTASSGVFYGNGSALTVSGGAFYDNVSVDYTFFVAGGAFYMTGGKIEGNTTTEGSLAPALMLKGNGEFGASIGRLSEMVYIKDKGVDFGDDGTVLSIGNLDRKAACVVAMRELLNEQDGTVYDEAEDPVTGFLMYTGSSGIDPHDGWVELEGALSELSAGNYWLGNDVTLTKTVSIAGDVCLCLNGCEIIGETAPYFTVAEGASLTLCDHSKLQLGCLNGNGMEGALVRTAGTVVLLSGGMQNADCAVEVTETGSCQIAGGFLKNLKTAVRAIGTADQKASVSLSGGKLSGNVCAISGEYTDVTISGGSVSDNVSTDAVVEVANGTLNVSGGAFTANEAEAILFCGDSQASVTGGTVRANQGYPLILSGGAGTISGSAVLEDLGVLVKNGGSLTIQKLTSGASVYAPVTMEGLTVVEGDTMRTTLLDNGLNCHSYMYEKLTGHTGWKPLNGVLTEIPAGSYYLTTDVTAEGVVIAGEVTICLNGMTVTGSKAPYFTIADGGNLTICDHSVSNSGAVVASSLKESVANGLFRIQAGGTMTLRGGSIFGHITELTGGAIYSEGTFVMEGGKIHTNTADKGSAIASVGTKTQRATLTITGGTITGNQDVTGGSAVYAKYTDVTMTGGMITKNMSKSSRIVWCDSSVFTMSGGEISGNENANGTVCKAVYLGKSTGGTPSHGVFFGNAVVGDKGVQLYDTDTAEILQLEDDGVIVAQNNTLTYDPDQVQMTEDLENGTFIYTKKSPFTNGVTIMAADMTVEDDNLSLGTEWLKKSLQLTATLEDDVIIPGKKFNWYSSNTSVATVSTSGKMTLRGLGTTVITVKVLDDYDQNTGYYGAITVTIGEEPLRVLAVGNPSTRDALMYLSDLALLTGNRIELGVAAPSKASVRDHTYNISLKKSAYYYYKTNADTGTMKQMATAPVTMDAIVRDNSWDIVILQHGLDTVGYFGTYTQDVQYLLDYFHNEIPGSQIYWNMGWAIEEKQAAETEYRSKTGMYNAIVRCMEEFIAGKDTRFGDELAGYAATGAAMEHLRSLVSYPVTRSNGVDLSFEAGRLTTAMVMLKTIVPDADLDMITTKGLSGFLSEYDAALGKYAPDLYENTEDSLKTVKKAVLQAIEDATTGDLLPELLEQEQWQRNTEDGIITVSQTQEPYKLHFADVATDSEGNVYVPAYESVVHVMTTGEGNLQEGVGRILMWKSTDGGKTFDTENPLFIVDEAHVEEWGIWPQLFNMYKNTAGNTTKAKSSYIACDPRDPNVVTVFVDTDGDGEQEEVILFTCWIRFLNNVGSYTNRLISMQSEDGGETWTTPQIISGVGVSGVKRGDITWFEGNRILVPIYGSHVVYGLLQEWDVTAQKWVAVADYNVPDTSPGETGDGREFNEVSFISPKHDNEVFAYVRASGAVLRSDDYGATWEEVGNEPGGAQQPGFALLDEDHVFTTWAMGTQPRDTRGRVYNMRAQWLDTPSSLVYESPDQIHHDTGDPSCATLPDGTVYTVHYDTSYRSIVATIEDPWSEEYLPYEIQEGSLPQTIHEEALDGGVTLDDEMMTVGEEMDETHTVLVKTIFTESDQTLTVHTRNGDVVVSPDSVTHGNETAELALVPDTENTIRISLVGNDVYIRIWQEEEPSDWNIVSSGQQAGGVTTLFGDGVTVTEAKILKHVQFVLQDSVTVEAAGVAVPIEFAAYPMEDHVIWSSSDPKIATAKDGVIYGKRAGAAVITATLGDVSLTCEVTVTEAPREIDPYYEREILLQDDFGKYDIGRNTFWEYHWANVATSLYAFREKDAESLLSGNYRIRDIEENRALTLSGKSWFMSKQTFTGDYTAQFDYRFNQNAFYEYLYVTLWQQEYGLPYDVYCFLHMRYNGTRINYRDQWVSEESSTEKNPQLYGGEGFAFGANEVPTGQWGTMKIARINGGIYIKTWLRDEPEPLNWDGVVYDDVLDSNQPTHFRIQWSGSSSNLIDIDNLIISRATDTLIEHTHVYDQEVVADRFLANEATTEAAAEYFYSCSCGEAGVETFFYGEPLPEEPETELFDGFVSRMTLGNALELQVGVPKEAMEDWTGAYAKVTMGGETEEIPYEDWAAAGPYYALSVALAAKEMTEDVTVQIFGADDQPVSEVYTDSVRAYVERNYEGSNDETKTLMVDMLNYGAAAQEYFGYKTEDLANAGLTEEQQAMASEEVECTDGRVTGENYLGSRLVLESRISLQLAFKNVDESCYAVYTYTDHYGEEKSVTVDGADFIGGYGVELGELVLADAKQLVTCTVYNESDEAVASVTDSVESYIARATEENILHGAIMKFAASAYNYFH